MDPNATLVRIHELLDAADNHRKLADEAADGDSFDDEIGVLSDALVDFEELVESVRALETWLANGGFAPTWRAA